MSKRDPNSLEAQLEKVRAEVSESNQTVTFNEAKNKSLVAEIAAHEAKKAEVLANIRKETTKLLAEREQALQGQADAFAPMIKEAQDAVKLAHDQLSTLLAGKSRLEVKTRSLATELADLGLKHTQMFASMDKVQNTITDLRAKELELEGVIEAAQRLKTSLDKDIQTSQNDKDRLEADITKLENAYELRMTETQAKIAEADKALKTLQQQRVREQRDYEQERQDLATRILAADERDRVLKIRERKVREGETFIQQNAGLMEL